MKKPTIREKVIENSILSWLAINRIFAFKVESIGVYDQRLGIYRLKHSIHRKLGISDILGIYKGKPLAIEVKSAQGRLSPHQKDFLEDWKKEGGIAIVAKCIEDVEKALISADKAATPVFFAEDFEGATYG